MKETILSIPSPLGPTVTLCKNSWQASAAPDSTLAIVSGMQGDQLNGLYLNSRLTRFLNDVAEGREADFRLKGKVQIFPVVNVHAVRSGSRLWPFDDLDLDLAFPGNEKGEVAEQIAQCVLTHTADSTHGVILRTGDHLYEDAPHAQLLHADRTSRKMAQSLGLDIVRELAESPTSKLNLLHHWCETGIASLMISFGRPQTLDRALCDSLFDGLLNLLVHTEVLSTTRSKNDKTDVHFFRANGNYSILSEQAGLFIPEVETGIFLKQGQKLGELRDIYSGDILEEYTVPKDGYLVTLRHHPVLYEKEPIAIILTEKKSAFWPF